MGKTTKDTNMKIIIAGSQSILSQSTIDQGMQDCPFPEGEITEVVCGGAKGPDSLGKVWANKRGIQVTMFEPDWSQGRHMGMVRNHLMGDYADCLVAFWNGESPGTKDMIDYMRKLKKPVYVVQCFVTVFDQLIREDP